MGGGKAAGRNQMNNKEERRKRHKNGVKRSQKLSIWSFKSKKIPNIYPES